MRQSGSSSITFAKIFSASEYSNECNKAVARLKFPLAFSLHDWLTFTVPNSPFSELQRAISPRMRSMDFNSASRWPLFFLPLQDRIVNSRTKQLYLMMQVISQTGFRHYVT